MRRSGTASARGSGLRTLTAILACWLSFGTLVLDGAIENADAPLEYKVKAAFLLNFPKFIDWPAAAFPAADSPFNICILGDDPFNRALDRAAEGEVVNGHHIQVQRIRKGETRSCAILFIPRSEPDVPRVLQTVEPGVLTVGESDRFLREGGMVAFVLEERHVRFDINQTVATRAGLQISARLLNVARAVEK